MTKRTIYLLLVLLIVAVSAYYFRLHAVKEVVLITQPYAQAITYAKGEPIQFPDFTLTYTGDVRVAAQGNTAIVPQFSILSDAVQQQWQPGVDAAGLVTKEFSAHGKHFTILVGGIGTDSKSATLAKNQLMIQEQYNDMNDELGTTASLTRGVYGRVAILEDDSLVNFPDFIAKTVTVTEWPKIPGTEQTKDMDIEFSVTEPNHNKQFISPSFDEQTGTQMPGTFIASGKKFMYFPRGNFPDLAKYVSASEYASFETDRKEKMLNWENKKIQGYPVVIIVAP